MPSLNITLPNLTNQFHVLDNFTNVPTDPANVSQAGWFYPIFALYNPIGDVVWLLVIAFTMGIVYIRTSNLTAMAFVAMMLSAFVITFVPSLGAKILYITVIFTITATLWLVFGDR